MSVLTGRVGYIAVHSQARISTRNQIAAEVELASQIITNRSRQRLRSSPSDSQMVGCFLASLDRSDCVSI